jgi:hypothetical protein
VAPFLKDWQAILAHDWNTLLCIFFIVNIVPAAVLFPVCIGKQNFSATRFLASAPLLSSAFFPP